MARIRHVFDTGEIPSLWMYDQVSDGWARNKQKNLSYRGQSLRSYATEIARKIDIPRRRMEANPTINGTFPHTMILISDCTYSTTTSQHIWAAEYLAEQSSFNLIIPVQGGNKGGDILSHGSRHDFIPIIDRKEIVRFHTDQREYYLDKASRARENQDYYLRKAEYFERKCEHFKRYFPIPGKNKKTLMTLDADPAVHDSDSDAKVRELLMDFTNPRSKRKWMAQSDSIDFTRRVDLSIVTTGIRCKHITYRHGKAKVSETFATLVTKYPHELKTLCDMQEAMNL